MITINQWENHHVRHAFIKGIPHRIQVLLSAIWANHVLHLFEQQCRAGFPINNRPRKAIEMAFDFALTGIVDENAAYVPFAAVSAARAADINATAADINAATAAYSAAYAARSVYDMNISADCAASAAAGCAYAVCDDDTYDWNFIYNTYLRSINQIQFNPSWKTEQTVGIAKQIWENRNVGNLPILADALQDAGVEENLTELRNIDQYTTLANWWLWNLNLEKQ